MIGLAIVLYIFAVIFIGIGLFTMYTYTYDIGRIVGADAYNYIIIGIRGLAWIVMGVGLGVQGALCALLASREAPAAPPAGAPGVA